jgi:hypothetical protein
MKRMLVSPSVVGAQVVLLFAARISFIPRAPAFYQSSLMQTPDAPQGRRRLSRNREWNDELDACGATRVLTFISLRPMYVEVVRLPARSDEAAQLNLEIKHQGA